MSLTAHNDGLARWLYAPLPFSTNVKAKFLRHWLRDPMSVGAIAPSSRYLAAAMAEGAEAFDAIVEVGGGTGAITQALANRNPEARLVVFELSEQLADGLHARFPRAQVVAGAFHENVSVLHDLPPKTVVVSGLPFRSLPARIVRPTVEALADVLRADQARRLVQFSYRLRAPFAAPADFVWRRVCTVWRNAPPANVWELQGKLVSA
ncbi:phospholipid N-methyltransferase [Paraburkholderia sp. BL9I2N2]|nr:phospholipid N-methyltransferase [Paraburkholderia sp. BL9I2N2]